MNLHEIVTNLGNAASGKAGLVAVPAGIFVADVAKEAQEAVSVEAGSDWALYAFVAHVVFLSLRTWREERNTRSKIKLRNQQGESLDNDETCS